MTRKIFIWILGISVIAMIIGAAWFGVSDESEMPARLKVEREVASHIRHLGGEVEFDETTGRVKSVDMLRNITDEDLRLIGKLGSLEALHLRGMPITNRGAKIISRMKSLEFLAIDGTKVGDEGIRELAKLPALRIFSIHDLPVTNVGAEYISHMPMLESLYAGGTEIDDIGIASLARLRLKELVVNNTRISDGIATLLPQFDSLRHISLYDNNIGDAAILELCNLSELKIVRLHRTRVSTDSLRALICLPNLELVTLPIDMQLDVGRVMDLEKYDFEVHFIE